MSIESKYFRVTKKEYCHITDNEIFVFNSKHPSWIPPEHDLSEAWGIVSILNYILFIFLFVYTGISINIKGADFFTHLHHYGVLLLLVLSLMRIQKGFNTSRTPTIPRKKIKSIYLDTPTFSFPRLIIYFEGPNGKVLEKTIPVLYKQEALPILQEAGFKV